MHARHLSVAHKLWWLVSIPVAAQIGSIALLFKIQQDTYRAQAWTIHSQAVTFQAYSVLNRTVQMDSAARAFMHMKELDETTLQRINMELKEAVAQLTSLVSEGPTQMAAVEAVRLIVHEQSEMLDAIKSYTDPEPKRSRDRSHIHTSNQQIRTQMGAFVRDNLASTTARQQAQQRLLRQLHYVFVIAVGGTFALTFTMLGILTRDIRQRLNILTQNTQRLVQGKDLEPLPDGADELAVLDRSFREMAVELAQAIQAERSAKELAEAASRAKSRFLTMMSHELRTPLNAILGFSEALRDQEVGPLNATQQDYLRDVIESGQHLLMLINTVLDFSKFEAGKLELALEPCNLSSIITESLSTVRALAARKSITTCLDVWAEIPIIQADPMRLKQILLNLLSNAIKFTPEKGQLGITASFQSNAVDIAVWDTGIGIDPADQSRIFEEFQQLDSDYARRYPGTGLGLPLAKRLVELHGGKLWVESEGYGKGSRFIVRLPVGEEP